MKKGIMHKACLRKVGGSVMLAVPPAILELLELEIGSTVGVSVKNGQMLIAPQPKPKYSLSELLAASDYSEPQPASEREWLVAPAVGRESI